MPTPKYYLVSPNFSGDFGRWTGVVHATSDTEVRAQEKARKLIEDGEAKEIVICEVIKTYRRTVEVV